MVLVRYSDLTFQTISTLHLEWLLIAAIHALKFVQSKLYKTKLCMTAQGNVRERSVHTSFPTLSKYPSSVVLLVVLRC